MAEIIKGLNFKPIQKNTQNGGIQIFKVSPELPFGVVMATAGLAVLLRNIDQFTMAHILTGLAVLQAIGIPVITLLENDGTGKIFGVFGKPKPLGYYPGIFTIPLGLAVISGSLITQAESSWIQILGLISLSLAWLLSILLLFFFVRSLRKYGGQLIDINGSWFLIPAAFLGVVMATHATFTFSHSIIHQMTKLLILAGCLLGWIGYIILSILAVIRIYRYRLQQSSFAPWWIFMGCAGLAAAAIGQTMTLPFIHQLPIATIFRFAMYTVGLWGIALFLPIIAISIIRIRLKIDKGKSTKIPWPPTFSTVVFALGCLRMYKTSGGTGFHYLALLGIFIASALWIITLTRNAW